MSYLVNMLWDAEAQVWVATSDDVPGLVLESGSFDALVERVRFAIPQLLEMNNIHSDVLNIKMLSSREERIAL